MDVEGATSIREVQEVLAAHRKTVPEGAEDLRGRGRQGIFRQPATPG